MWPDDDDLDAALRGEYQANPTAEVNWARIIAGAVVLTVVAVLAVVVAIMGVPGPTV
jgi:hypothetical protein